MQSAIFNFSNGKWNPHTQHNNCKNSTAQLAICFAAKKILSEQGIYQLVKQQFPAAQIVMCSTAGEIFHDAVKDDSLVAVAMQFDKTTIQSAIVNINDCKNSFDAGFELVKKLPLDNLAYILVLSDGGMVNGSELVKGLNVAVDNKVLITGGLAGDGSSFVSTLVGLNQQPAQGNIAAIGFYGKHLLVTHGSQGGWEMFGPERDVTRSTGNKLYEMDSKNALDLYKRYLGKEAENLPGSALLFPLSVIIPGSIQPVVRTILSIDEKENSMTFAGDIPQGSKVRLMKSNFDKITTAASSAAQQSIMQENCPPDVALLISCVGRKLILGSRINEEVEAVNELLGGKTLLAGFYSYGEISPFNEGGSCQLHNQTMTITSFYESK